MKIALKIKTILKMKTILRPKTCLEDEDNLEDEDCIEEEGYFEGEDCLCKDVCPLISCNGAILAYEDIITFFILFLLHVHAPFFFLFFF